MASRRFIISFWWTLHWWIPWIAAITVVQMGDLTFPEESSLSKSGLEFPRLEAHSGIPSCWKHSATKKPVQKKKKLKKELWLNKNIYFFKSMISVKLNLRCIVNCLHIFIYRNSFTKSNRMSKKQGFGVLFACIPQSLWNRLPDSCQNFWHTQPISKSRYILK